MRVLVVIFENWARYSPHFLIRVLSSIRIFSSAFYPPSAFSHPRFILHPHFLIRVLFSIRIFSSAFYFLSAFSHPRFILHPHFLIRVLSSIRIFSSVFSHPHPYPRFIPTLFLGHTAAHRHYLNTAKSCRFLVGVCASHFRNQLQNKTKQFV